MEATKYNTIFFKKVIAPIKNITDQLVSYLICPKCVKTVYIKSYPTF